MQWFGGYNMLAKKQAADQYKTSGGGFLCVGKIDPSFRPSDQRESSERD